MDAFSIKGLSQMFDELNKMKKHFGHRPQVLLVPTFYDERLRRCREAMDYLHENFAAHLSSVRIPMSEDLPSNLARPAPLALLQPTAKVNVHFNELVDEILAKSYEIAATESGKGHN